MPEAPPPLTAFSTRATFSPKRTRVALLRPPLFFSSTPDRRSHRHLTGFDAVAAAFPLPR
jgi:hypothetical protein